VLRNILWEIGYRGIRGGDEDGGGENQDERNRRVAALWSPSVAGDALYAGKDTRNES
jgi:hypothetical protein